MTRSWIFAALISVTLFAAQSVKAEDTVNPAFHAWARFGIGSSATMEGTIDLPKGPATSVTVCKLVEKAADHVVIETTTTMTVNGQAQTTTQKQTIEAAPDPSKEMTQIGAEDIVAAGKTLSCKIYEPTHPKPNSAVKTKVWASAEVPGGAVKVEINMTRTNSLHTIMLKAFEVKGD